MTTTATPSVPPVSSPSAAKAAKPLGAPPAALPGSARVDSGTSTIAAAPAAPQASSPWWPWGRKSVGLPAAATAPKEPVTLDSAPPPISSPPPQEAILDAFKSIPPPPPATPQAPPSGWRTWPGIAQVLSAVNYISGLWNRFLERWGDREKYKGYHKHLSALETMLKKTTPAATKDDVQPLWLNCPENLQRRVAVLTLWKIDHGDLAEPSKEQFDKEFPKAKPEAVFNARWNSPQLQLVITGLLDKYNYLSSILRLFC